MTSLLPQRESRSFIHPQTSLLLYSICDYPVYVLQSVKNVLILCWILLHYGAIINV